jgi:CBS domain-containing protein
MVGSEVVKRIVQNLNRVVSIGTAETVAEACRKMREHDIGSLVVLDGEGKVTGILTERDIVGLVARTGDSAATTVGACMTPFVVTCTLQTPLDDVIRLMSGNRIRHLPVVEDGRPVGMVSSRDLLAYELKTTKAVVQRQSMLLTELESAHPGITRVKMTGSGRVII